MRITCKFSLLIILAYSFSARDCNLKSTGVEKRRLHIRAPNDCQWDQFWTSEGCRTCSSCVKLRLRTSVECGSFSDEVCQDICLYKNDVFDSVTKQCMPAVSSEGLVPAKSDTSDQKVELTTVRIVPTAEEEVQSHDSNVPIIAIWTVVALIVSATILLSACIFCWMKQKFGKGSCDGISGNDEDVLMVIGPEFQNRPQPAIPERQKLDPTSEEPSPDLTDTTYAAGVPYSQPPSNRTRTEDPNIPRRSGNMESNDNIYSSVD